MSAATLDTTATSKNVLRTQSGIESSNRALYQLKRDEGFMRAMKDNERPDGRMSFAERKKEGEERLAKSRASREVTTKEAPLNLDKPISL